MAARSDRFGWLIAILPCVLVVGCGGADEGIKTYRVATAPGKGPVVEEAGPTPVEAGPPKVRLLGAIIPVGGDSYFVKFVGPIDKIDANEKDFDTFVSSIKVPTGDGKPSGWTVPPGWREAPTKSMRVVTLQKIDGSAPDMYLSDRFGGDLLSNVNRWRTDDVGLPRATAAELPTVTKEVQLGTTKAHRVDLRGPGGKKGTMPPFAGGKN